MLSALVDLHVSRPKGAMFARTPARAPRGPSTSKMLIYHLPCDPTNLFLVLLAAFGLSKFLFFPEVEVVNIFKSASWAMGGPVADLPSMQQAPGSIPNTTEARQNV